MDSTVHPDRNWMAETGSRCSRSSTGLMMTPPPMPHMAPTMLARRATRKNTIKSGHSFLGIDSQSSLPEPLGQASVRAVMDEAEVEMARRGLPLHKVGHGWTGAVLGYDTDFWHGPAQPERWS